MRSRTSGAAALLAVLVSCTAEPSADESAQAESSGSTPEPSPAPQQTESGGANPAMPLPTPAGSGPVDATGGGGAEGVEPQPTPNPALPATPSGGAQSTGGTSNAPSGGGTGGASGAGGTPAVIGDAGVADMDASVNPEPAVCDATRPVEVGALGLELVASAPEITMLSYAAQPPGSEDWYLVEQDGRIHVWSNGALRPEPFYDVSSEMSLDASYDERGLHAIAFAPDYETSGLFYVVLTPTTGDRANRDLLLEHRRSEADPYVADMTPTKELLATDGISPNSLFANIHNNYLVAFGPDGMLYVGTGDGGGSCNDNTGFVNLPQDRSSGFGKILRLDPKADAPYAAAGNPFANDGDPRVLHYGLRNPFRFSWDAENGDLYIGDVGQDTHEEINIAPSGSMGLNFGWAAWEGDEQVCQNRPQDTDSEVSLPIFFTDHGGGGQFGAGCNTSPFCDFGAIVGGFVYRGAAIEKLYGAYIFGDWVSDNMAAIRHCDGVTSEVTAIDYVRDPNLPNDGYFVKVGDGVPDVSSITAVLQGHDRELYLVANRTSLVRIVPAP